jgi:hypothetical protein
LEAGLCDAEEAVVSVPTYYTNSLKNGIWRRVSALSKLMKAIDILGPEKGDEENANTLAPHDSPCHTTYEVVEQRPPLNPISATAAVRRGVGRRVKCGRKRKEDRVTVAEGKDKKTKGADNHKDYREAVKSVLRWVVENAVECDQSVRAAATQAQTTLFKDDNITISHSWCRALISTSIKISIPVPTPQKIGGTLIPLAIEERVDSVVRRVRSTKLHVLPDDVMAWATHLIKGTNYEQNFDEGQASEGWYRGILRRHNFLTGAERPLEITRHE